jgi:dihydroorotase
MQKTFLLIVLLISAMGNVSQAQSYSLVIKNGHVIDPKNNIDAVMDVAVQDGKIARVAEHINADQAAQVVDAQGMYVTPGLVDIHTHVFTSMRGDPSPDGYTLQNGITTCADAGTSGWRSFPAFKKEVIDKSQTRVLAFLNIIGGGMRGSYFEQDPGDMDPTMTALVAKRYRNIVVGVKTAHYEGGWTAVDSAVAAGKLAGIPVMVDFGGANPPLSIRSLFFDHLRPGDIFTHCFAQLGSREFILDTATGKIKPFVWEAQKRGTIFDVGYGGISFAFSQAIPAMKDGFRPNSISTDYHKGDMNAAMKNILNVMDKFLIMGMDLPDVIRRTTWNPAQEINHKELGHLTVGVGADVAIFKLIPGNFGFFDYTGYRIEGKEKLECEMTVRAGKIVYDLNGIAKPVVLPNQRGE